MRQKQQNVEMITRLSNANGISGFEDEVVELGIEYAKDYCDIKVDSLRNLYMSMKTNKNNRPLVLLDAHSDEVGFITQAIKPNGTLRFLPIGGWNTFALSSSPVRVKNQEGRYLPGVIATTPPHFLNADDKNKTPQINQMYIDLGATSKEDLDANYKIDMAAPIVPDVNCRYDSLNDTFIGKAFDCRIGCAALLKTIEDLSQEKIEVDVVATFSVQEEVGERGIQTVVNSVKPDIAIVFEGCPADDTFSENYMIQTALKKGPMIRHYDTTLITNPRYMRYALDLGKKLNIPVQESVRSGGGQNGAIITLSNQGVPTIVIGVPVRYIHSHFGICAYYDFENASKLALEIIKSLNADIISKF